MLTEKIRKQLSDGCVIPAHPLALDKNFRIDEIHQRALTRYYLSAGAGGLAVGVHTTQFEIHDKKIDLYKPVLELASETANCWREKVDTPILIAGILGDTKNAVQEAETARKLGYHIGLVSLTALKGKSISVLTEHIKAISEIIPVMGFYLQETISGMKLPIEFWREFVKIENVVAIKLAPFNRYQSLDVIRAVAESGREDIALYTGNDDSIIVDLLTRFEFNVAGKIRNLQIVGGLLGQWACWTRGAVNMLDQIKIIRSKKHITDGILTLASQLTLANEIIFDAEHNFIGCISGILYVLQRVGLVENIRILNSSERLSAGQAEQIEQIARDYPHLTDDEFVKENIDQWLR